MRDLLRSADGSSSTRRVFWWAFAALCLVFGTWALANPLTAAPDEPSHMVKAAAVVRGELGGEVRDPTSPDRYFVDVPAVAGLTIDMPRCFAFKPDVTAACMQSIPEGDAGKTMSAATTAVTYNPTYYAIVGLPTLAPMATESDYLMRGVSAALCAALLAWSFAQAAGSRRPDWTSVAVLLSITPMVVFLSSAVSPASVEIAGAAALWSSLGALVHDPRPDRFRSRMAAVGIIGTVFVNLRGLSPLFLAIIVLAVVLTAPWSATWAVLRDRRSWPWIALVSVATVLALVWTGTAGSLSSDGTVRYPDFTFWFTVQWSLGDTSAYLSNMIGQFGWVDTNLPWWLLTGYGVTAGFLVVLAVAVGIWRERTALLLLGVITVAGPVLIQSSQALYIGPVWQGRYFLPAAVGLPILSGIVLSKHFAPIADRVGNRAVALFATVWVVAQVTAFIVNWHRYAYGTDVGWLHAPADAWSPPVPIEAPAAVFLVGLLGVVGLCLSFTSRREPAPDGTPALPMRESVT